MRGWLLWAAIPVLGIGALVVVPLVIAGAPTGSDSALCLIRRWSGVPCPGCGMTRAFGSLALGELRQAWSFHPMAPLVVAEGVVGWVLWGLHLGGRSVAWVRDSFEALLWGHVAVLGALWLGRLATGTLPW